MPKCLKSTAAIPVSNEINMPISSQMHFDFLSAYDMSLVATFQGTEELQDLDLSIAFFQRTRWKG